uniref:Uncharacterized protein n=1 Tax=Chromera velia CCMP2878 TaxID=1169474 RepID=A0A0G4I0T0_9ALVE|eukprot:Cvel_10021.t1-p1 / transcript=Cvel_10021.t1 / gene=Cvel_10021 / organism=Chromera_velia_CCMP2878 / gene_product=hypothetical protein / transcript_product=hypothetical protein / location=Cvel_scaffold595:8563-10071(-) / protein_length=368 / sequence_SO=supercontig / SO=protein_coding / is_pseudo=false
MKYRTYRMVWVPRRRVKSEPALPVSQVLSEFGHRVEKPDSDDEEQGQPDTFVKSLRSVGSLYHQPGGNCKSRKCFWFFSRKGCDRGWLCPHCHYCAPMGGAPEARVDPIKSPSISSMFLHVPPQRGVPVGVGGVGGSGQTRIDVHRGSHQSSSSSSSSSGGAGASGTQRSVRDQERIRGLHWGRREGVRGLSSTLPPFSSIGPLTGPIGSSGRSAERGRGSASRSERGLEGDGTERERGREGRQTEEEEEGVSLSPTLRDPPHRFHAISPPARAASSAAAVAPVRPTSSSSRSAFLTDTRGIALPFRASPALPGDGLSWRSQIPGAPAEGVQTEGAPSPRPSPSEASSPFHSPSPSPKSLSKHGRRRG